MTPAAAALRGAAAKIAWELNRFDRNAEGVELAHGLLCLC